MIDPEGASNGSAALKKPTRSSWRINQPARKHWAGSNKRHGAPKSTLIVPDLPIDIFRQATYMREIEYHFVKASLLDLFSSSTAFCYPRIPQLGGIDAILHYAILLRFEGGNIEGCLWIFASKRGDLIVASGNQISATMCAEEGAGEREVAFPDEENAVGRGEWDGWGWRFRTNCGLAQ